MNGVYQKLTIDLKCYAEELNEIKRSLSNYVSKCDSSGALQC